MKQNFTVQIIMCNKDLVVLYDLKKSQAWNAYRQASQWQNQNDEGEILASEFPEHFVKYVILVKMSGWVYNCLIGCQQNSYYTGLISEWLRLFIF